MFEGRKRQRLRRATDSRTFPLPVELFENVFSALFRTERLRRHRFRRRPRIPAIHDQLLRYLRRCISGDDHPFALPDIPVFLNDLLAAKISAAALSRASARKHIRVIAIDGFPKASFPGFLGELDSLPIEYRWNTRAILLDAEEAEAILDKTRKKWRSQIRGWKDQVLKNAERRGKSLRAEMAGDAEQAMSVAASGDVHFARYQQHRLHG